MRCIDAHTHVFPDEIVGNRERFARDDSWFSQLYSDPRSKLATVEALIGSMDTAGIDHSVICGFPWRSQSLCNFHNEYMDDVSRRFPERISWLAIVSKNLESSYETTTNEILDRGAIGIGEINADAQEFELESADHLAEVLAVCRDRGKPVMFHVSEPLGHQYPGKGRSTPVRFLQLVAANPDVTFVAAHWGGGLPFYELMPEVRSQCANVVYDSAASTYLYDEQIFRSVIDVVGSGRVLFGSDYPVLRQEPFKRKALSVDWRDETERDNVMFKNAAKLFGIGLKEGELS
ncbi:amidohydrolase family protein [soil metagenome]